jgi:hypothetical protein
MPTQQDKAEKQNTITKTDINANRAILQISLKHFILYAKQGIERLSHL